jgi:hypothetical protein
VGNTQVDTEELSKNQIVGGFDEIKGTSNNIASQRSLTSKSNRERSLSASLTKNENINKDSEAALGIEED